MGEKEKSMIEIQTNTENSHEKRGGMTYPKAERSIEAKRRRGAGRKHRKEDRLKAVNQFGDHSPQNPK
ncbi:hypothetical protein TNCV_769151 [Trichonephila clavipes]|nr:hypothetical protein TNCV_769151 [Trichonephila clavipes]